MTSQSKQVVIRPTSNENVREYHIIGEQISNLPYAEFWHPMRESESEFDALGAKGKKFATKLMGKGNEKTIARTVFRPESVRVYKSPVSDWATVETTIVLPALNEALGATFQPVQYGSIKHRELALV